MRRPASSQKPCTRPTAPIDPGAAGAPRRRARRSGAAMGQRHTSGLADDLVQGNLVILPQADAADFLLLLPAQPAALPAARRRRRRRPVAAGARRRHRRAHRPAALPRLARRRARRRADRHPRAVARRPRRLRDRLLVLVRVGAAAPRACRCATSSTAATCRCTAPTIADRAGRRVSRAAGGVDAAAARGRRRSARCRSRRAFRRCTARRCTSATRR